MLGHVRGEDGNCTVCDEVYSVAIWVAGVQITAENMEDILGDGTASFDDATDTLTLNGFNHIGEEKGIYSEIPLNIVLVGENTITDSYIGIDSYVLDGAINISGTGTLTIDSSYEGMYVSSTYGVCLTIGGSVTINLINNNNQVPFYMYGDTVDLVITDNAKLTIGTEDAPVEEECIYVEGYTSGSVTISGNAEVHLENNDEEGIYVFGEQESITITGGSVYINAEEEGLDADTITITGGTVEAYGDVGYEGIYAQDLTITGGIITVGGKEQGIEAENITITGGILTVVEGGLIAVGDDGLPGTITLTGVEIVEPQGATIGTVELEEEGTVKAVLNADGTYADAFVIRPVEGDVKNGIVAEDGKLYYYENDVRTYAGLIKIGSDYYYVRTSGEVVTSRSYWITKHNDLLPAANYYFDETGKLSDKNGFIAEDGGIYYYENGVRTYAGLMEIDGDYYYVRSSGEVITGRHYWITKTNDLLPADSYYFDEEGKLYPPVDEVKSGIYQEGDKLFYYENNQRTYAGLMEIDGKYYYVRTSGEVVTNRSYWITKTNDLLPVGNYEFDENGVMTNPPA
jgi:glucan-binding YG repeat protein